MCLFCSDDVVRVPAVVSKLPLRVIVLSDSISIFPFIVALFNVPPICTSFAIPTPPETITEPDESLELSVVP